MRLRVGTSGFAYPEWVGPFYPEGLPREEWLAHYATRLSSVELNNSFYRVPRTSVVHGWRDAVGSDFRIVLKASRRVTHFGRLKPNTADSLGYVLRAAEALGERRGPLLFQLPPQMRADAERLRAFLRLLPEDCPAAFELRNPSWRTPETAETLRAFGAAWVVAQDDGDEAPRALEATARFGYLRLRCSSYTEDELDRWAELVRAARWDEAFVFFKHEDAGAGPALAERFARRFDGAEGEA